MKISVFGLGKLGLCTASCFAAKGHDVTGVDSNTEIVNSINTGHCPINETGLPELLNRAKLNLRAVSNAYQAVYESDASLIIVPTPSNKDGRFINDFVISAIKAMAPAIRAKNTFHIVDVVSTVMPGSCDTVFKPLLEKETGKTCGTDFGLVYNPEFIALGSVIRDFLNPDMVLIGASDTVSSSYIEKLYASMVESSPRYSIMSLVNAEITKLSLNCYVTMKISFANEIAALCEKIPGANVDAVTNAIGADSRVGRKYLKGGLGFGGPCFPRDNIAFQQCAKEFGYQAKLGPQVVAINMQVVDRLFTTICKKIPAGSRVAILGLSYKPGTHIVEESQSIMLAVRLADKGYKVVVHDPAAADSARSVIGEKASYCPNVIDAIRNSSCLVLMTPWQDYSELINLNLADLLAPGAAIIDSWRTFADAPPTGISYSALGMGR